MHASMHTPGSTKRCLGSVATMTVTPEAELQQICGPCLTSAKDPKLGSGARLPTAYAQAPHLR